MSSPTAVSLAKVIVADVERVRSFGVQTQREYWLRLTPAPPESSIFHDEVVKEVWKMCEAGVVWTSPIEVRIHLVPSSLR